MARDSQNGDDQRLAAIAKEAVSQMIRQRFWEEMNKRQAGLPSACDANAEKAQSDEAALVPLKLKAKVNAKGMLLVEAALGKEHAGRTADVVITL
jgi:hypothetical protein